MKRLVVSLCILLMIVNACWAGDKSANNFIISYFTYTGSKTAMQTYNYMNSLKSAFQVSIPSIYQQPNFSSQTTCPSAYQQMSLGSLGQAPYLSMHQLANLDLQNQTLGPDFSQEIVQKNDGILKSEKSLENKPTETIPLFNQNSDD